MISPLIGKCTPSKDLTSIVASIRQELEHLTKFVDVHAVMLFRLDGKVLESRYETENSQDLLIVTSWVKNIIMKTMEELKRGSKSVKYDKEISSGKTIPVYFYRAGNSSILVTFLTSRANLGLMEIEMSRASKRLGQIIDNKTPLGS